jgi:hypothetical protein
METQIKRELVLPLSAIVADKEWNARSGDYETEGPDADEGLGIGGIALTMRDRGQDTAIDVRIHPRLPSKFLIMDGHRRRAGVAILDANGEAVKDLPRGHIRAIVRDVNEVEAREFNLRKGVQGNNLKPADVAFGVGELRKLGQSLSEIAKGVGKDPGYVSRLAMLADPSKFHPDLFHRWRDSSLPLSVNQLALDICRLPLHDQAARAEELLALGKSASEPKEVEPSAASVMASAVASVRRASQTLGWQLGMLEREGVLPPGAAPREIEQIELASGICVKWRRGIRPTAEVVRSVAEAMRISIEDGLAGRKRRHEEDEKKTRVSSSLETPAR